MLVPRAFLSQVARSGQCDDGDRRHGLGPLGGSAPAAHSLRGLGRRRRRAPEWTQGTNSGALSFGSLRSLSPRYDLRPSSSLARCARFARRAGRRTLGDELGRASQQAPVASRPMSAPPTDWVTRAADDAIRHAGTGLHQGKQVTVSSGVSPSGRVHLGNMREFLTVHFVADELRRRGVPVRHLHVWDDYDRFRKVPVGVDPSYADYIGRPLSAVPDPWDCHPSWAEHFKEPLVDALHAMGIEMEEVSQTERYTSGLYREQVLLAVRHRHDIEAVLARFRTKKTAPRRGLRPGGRLRWPTASPTTRTPRARPSWSGSPTSRSAAPASATPPRSRPTTTRPPTSPTPATAATPTPPTWPPRTRASWRGRSTGRCAGPSSTSTSSPPAWTTPRPVRRSRSGTSWSRRSSGCRGRPGSVTASSASPACRRCRRRRVARPPRKTPCACSRRRSCAGSTCAATPSRPSTSTSAPRSCGSTTSGTP